MEHEGGQGYTGHKGDREGNGKERKLEGAMEQMMIMNLDLGRVCEDRKTLAREALSTIKEKVGEKKRTRKNSTGL
jgi:hypothetical protein